ncbi:hypothetical protein GmHk_02G005376 [Glycine max]|nr:hypothetical protein GmHk_02G005376 [Glycine max]
MRDQQPFTTSLCAMIKSRFGVEKVRDADAPILVPTEEGALGSMKSADRPNHDLCAMLWDATVFGVINENFPVYIKHEDLSEITHGGQCLNNSIIQLWIFMRVGNVNVYGFLEPQSIQRSGQSQFESEKLDAKIKKGCVPKSLLERDLKILHKVNSRLLLGGLLLKQKGSIECGYYVMHWMSTIILGSFKNNWETYFNDGRPLEPKRLKVLRMEWATYYLKVKNETISV